MFNFSTTDQTKRLRIGILTYHRSINEGAILQAEATFRLVRKIRPKAEIELVDISSLRARIRDRRKVQRWGGSAVRWLHNIRRRQNIERYQETRLPLSDTRLWGDDYDDSVSALKNLNYDHLIVGSDEVWKLGVGRGGRAFPNIYFPANGTCRSTIAFAASANKISMDRLSPDKVAWIRNSLVGFEGIAVRDRLTEKFVKNFTDQTPELIVDPTLVAASVSAPDEPLPCEVERVFSQAGDRALGCVILENPDHQLAADEVLRSRGFYTIGLTSYGRSFSANVGDRVNPRSWEGVIRRSKVVITDRFHGTMLSVKHSVPFVCIDTQLASSSFGETKLSDFASRFGCKRALLSPDTVSAGSKTLTEGLDYALSEQVPPMDSASLGEAIKTGRSFLERFLEAS